MSHTCPYPRCRASVPHNMLSCKKHWYLLPQPLRSRIWAAYRTGATTDHRAALKEADDFYAHHAAEATGHLFEE